MHLSCVCGCMNQTGSTEIHPRASKLQNLAYPGVLIAREALPNISEPAFEHDACSCEPQVYELFNVSLVYLQPRTTKHQTKESRTSQGADVGTVNSQRSNVFICWACPMKASALSPHQLQQTQFTHKNHHKRETSPSV